MKITLLCENEVSDMKCLAEWGFSAFIEFDGVKILFDTGYSDVYLHNARLAGIDLEETDFIVLSHHHNDHTRGLLFHPFTDAKTIVCHPQALRSLDDKDAKGKADYGKIRKTINADFKVALSDSATEFSPGVFFLGHIPRVNDFESGQFEKDAMEDDTALAFKTDRGVVVVTGCSHAGICNICDHAMKVTGLKLYAVIGGFHLLAEENPPVRETVDYFKQQNPEVLLPMHCVDFEALVAFANAFGVQKYSAGDMIEL